MAFHPPFYQDCHFFFCKLNECVVGTWNLAYDWDGAGSTGSITIQYYADHTFTTSEGTTGTWSHTGNQFTRVYLSGTIYSGTVNAACDYMSGTMTSYSGSTGCWTSTLVSRGTAASSETLVKQEELLDEFDDSGRKKAKDN